MENNPTKGGAEFSIVPRLLTLKNYHQWNIKKRLFLKPNLFSDSFDGLQVALKLNNIFRGNDTYDFLPLGHTDPLDFMAKHLFVGFRWGQMLIDS